MKGIKCCAECADYSIKKHKCTRGAKDPGKSTDSFYADCPLDDAEPVRQGRWIDKGEYAVCTECGGRSGTQYDGVEPIPLMTQFCQNCGARMDGGADNGNG